RVVRGRPRPPRDKNPQTGAGGARGPPPPGGPPPADIGAIREQLAGGRKPRIVFTESAGQIAGQLGHVVALTDPAGSDEWIVVQFGRDELPFAPVDLATPTRVGTRAAAGPGSTRAAPGSSPTRNGAPA